MGKQFNKIKNLLISHREQLSQLGGVIRQLKNDAMGFILGVKPGSH